MTSYGYIIFTAVLLSTFVLSALFTRLIIPKLKSLKLGQTILDIGPRWHKSKEGTPTMGGLAFISATLLVCAVLVVPYLSLKMGSMPIKLTITLVFAALNGAVGIIDDMTKFKNHRNEGLTAGQKYLLQLVLSGAYLYTMTVFAGLDTVLKIPFTSFGLNLGPAYYIVALLLLTGIINSVNLTDGIDGLASSVTMVVGAAVSLLGFISGGIDASILGACTIGACLGFLTYNFYPAKIFMGDTGSLFLGAMVVGSAFVLDNPALILVLGIIYVAESLSVIIQVTSFKLTGKRVFKMSPIHHHLEKCGWSENEVVFVFTLVTAIMSVLAFLGV